MPATHLRWIEAQVLDLVLECGQDAQFKIFAANISCQKRNEFFKESEHFVRHVHILWCDSQVASEVNLLDVDLFVITRGHTMVIL